MPVSRTKLASLPHAVFLQRVSNHASPTSLEARLGQGSFLALRLVDLLASDRGQVSADAFHYQWVATDRFCRELRATSAEGAHIHGISVSAADAYRLNEIRLITPALFAYAHFLEDELRLEEALDVLATLLDIGGNQPVPADGVAAQLRVGRVNRKLNRFDDAEAAYTTAGELAAAHGDRYSELLSLIGRANSLIGRGNLAEAERALRSILADARSAGLRDAEARAEHGIGVTLGYRGQPDEAVAYFWRAFERYEDEDSQLRALGDVGQTLLVVGNAVAAEHALTEVVRRGGTREATTNAMIELMHCASFRRDRVGFARWRERSETRLPHMPPNIRADFYLKQAIGQARFGQYQRAEGLLDKALEVASAVGLHEMEFRIERIKHGLDACAQQLAAEPPATTEPVFDTEELREVSASLAQLVGA
ncbi:MAG TPA: tetratricopeptide repeat protein [Gemmatimonadales bacterium]|jgi:tetratricopeptide (TPR) repeat protein|nr:tetratricopeptide repeat protein [Gemmatimonadales bacterium]